MNELQTIRLKGQRTFEIQLNMGIHNVFFKIIKGKIRVNHCSYDPDGGTWLSSPGRGRQAHYNLSEGNETVLTFSIENSFGKKDRIIIVNPTFFSDAVFEFQTESSNDDSANNFSEDL